MVISDQVCIVTGYVLVYTIPFKKHKMNKFSVLPCYIMGIAIE